MAPRDEDDGEDEDDYWDAHGDAYGDAVRGAAVPGEIPGRLCAAAVRLLPVTGASVSLRVAGMPVRLSASDEAAARVAQVQETVGDGPCRHAAEVGAPVFASDLTRGDDVSRWPVFAQQAVAAGVRAVYSLPLGSDTACVGTLDLYRDTPGELTGRALRSAHLVAGVMTMALMAMVRGPQSAASGLPADHDEVHQAVGMIMVQLGVSADDALARLRAHAFVQGRTTGQTARDVVAGRKRFDRD
ncbi:GAF and ANTAR domain-containing protein [Streptomyces phyllanthi]|uniref:GAF and ANTAR domain-containing protein n=1 Tax=Streptomyces phyllanthi TaxID=1803180 RepID=UPI002AD4EC37|nr:GAF and ANTAR domain-containing protein [Streptomyces phyllanthi]